MHWKEVITCQPLAATGFEFCILLEIVAWSQGSITFDSNSWESFCHQPHISMELASFESRSPRVQFHWDVIIDFSRRHVNRVEIDRVKIPVAWTARERRQENRREHDKVKFNVALATRHSAETKTAVSHDGCPRRYLWTSRAQTQFVAWLGSRAARNFRAEHA